MIIVNAVQFLEKKRRSCNSERVRVAGRPTGSLEGCEENISVIRVVKTANVLEVETVRGTGRLKSQWERM